MKAKPKGRQGAMADHQIENERKQKGIKIGLLLAFLLTAVCIVFEILCLSYPRTGYLYEHFRLFCYLAFLITIVYFSLTVFFLLKDKQALFRTLLCGLILALFFLVLLYVLEQTGFFIVFRSTESFRAYLKKSGAWMPVLYIVLQYLQVVVLPIPGFVSTAAGVALLGPFKAFLCSFVGVVAGSFTAFWIGRKFGYKVVAWMIGKDDLDKWLKKVKGKDNFILTAMFVLPLFPDDVLCFVAGLSTMTWQYFVVMIVLSRFVAILTTCYSVNFIPFNTWWGLLIWAGIIVVVLVAFFFVYKKSDAMCDWFHRRFRKKKTENSASSPEEK